MKKLSFLFVILLSVSMNGQLNEENYLKIYKKIYFSENYDELDSLKTEIFKYSESNDSVIRNSIPSILKEIDEKQLRIDLTKYYAEKKNKIIKKYGKKLGQKLAYGGIEIGMTSEMVWDSLGNPDDINTTETTNTHSSQWVYRSSSGDRYYYFENKKVVAIQK